ncbi:MAG: DsbA family protein [Patescibacteria group bacterium]|nr:DsbA family protein [Patescibacteria group bacterium]
MMSTEKKVIAGVILSTILLIVGAIGFFYLQSKQEEKIYARDQLIAPHNNTIGNATASAYLVEFSDFQCPACAAYEPTVKQILEKHKDNLLFVYRHYPLPQHAFAEKAAAAAEAAGKQGKFWEMHNELFTRYNNLSDQAIQDIATRLSLDKERFMKDLNSEEIQNIVRQDKQAGNALGVRSTPTFFLNGKKLNVMSPSSLLQAVENALNAQ